MSVELSSSDADFDALDAKALTTPMSVIPDLPNVRGAEDMFHVQHAHEHTVAKVNDEWHCDCRGYQCGHKCYHIRRVEFATGERAIPTWVNLEAVDDQLGEHVDGDPVVATPERTGEGQP